MLIKERLRVPKTKPTRRPTRTFVDKDQGRRRLDDDGVSGVFAGPGEAGVAGALVVIAAP
jgi:hypothetical protein